MAGFAVFERWLLLLVHASLIVTTFSFDDNSIMKPVVNGLCALSQLRKSTDDKNHYMYCTPKKGFNVWQEGKCKGDSQFLEMRQRCISKSNVRYQESRCQAQPSGFGCPQKHCTAAGAEAVAGAPCDWLTAPLQPNSVGGGSNFYLQCNPTSHGSPCGVWNQLQCTNGTAFNVIIQVCITISLSSAASCQNNEIAISSCETENNNWCPFGSECRNGICCQPASSQGTTSYPYPYPYPQTVYPQPSQTLYPPPPPTLYPPPQPTGYPQPQPTAYPQPQPTAYSQPQPTAYPQPQPPAPYPRPYPQPQPPPQPYPQPYPPPPPPTRYPQPGTQRPQPYPQPGPQPYPQPGLQPYPQPGPQPYPQPGPPQPYPQPYPQPGPQPYPQPGPQPYPQPGPQPYPQPGPQPYPQPVPTVYPPSIYPQPYPQPGTVGPGSFLTTPKDLIICTNGQLAEKYCQTRNDCDNGFTCHLNSCCPLPNCPNGIVATRACHNASQCLPVEFCFNGGCCKTSGCPNGEMPIESCDAYKPCPSPFTCQSGACCTSSLPECPSGGPALTPCSPGGNQCPDMQYCYVDDNNRRGCCHIPICPNGNAAIQPCDKGGGCPLGQECIAGACCEIPGSVFTYYQTTRYPYPYPYPQTLTTPYPPTVVPPAKSCRNCCPSFQFAICFCAGFNNQCPQMTTCGSAGACCASGDAMRTEFSKKRPGDRCDRLTDCNGYETGTVKCANNNCRCEDYTSSDGFRCVKSLSRRKNRRRKARDLSSTNFVDAAYKNVTGQQQLRYWRPLGEMNCITNNECIPDMICINRTCYDEIFLLHVSCVHDGQCQLPDSVCSPVPNFSTEKICQCKPGYCESEGECAKDCLLTTKDNETSIPEEDVKTIDNYLSKISKKSKIFTKLKRADDETIA